ncbi:hypothetical protein D3C77_301380 [compost metagenome]
MGTRISHMESCLTCGTTTSSAIKENDEFEALAGKYIDLAMKSGDHKAVFELAKQQLDKFGLFYSTGGAGDGPSALYKLRRARITAKAMFSLIGYLEPVSNDEHHFDENGHKI